MHFKQTIIINYNYGVLLLCSCLLQNLSNIDDCNILNWTRFLINKQFVGHFLLHFYKFGKLFTYIFFKSGSKFRPKWKIRPEPEPDFFL